MFFTPVNSSDLPEGTHSIVSQDHFAKSTVTDLSGEERSRIAKLLTTTQLPEGTANNIREAYTPKKSKN